MGKLIFKVKGIECIAPVLTVSIIGAYIYKLDWNYNGVDYSTIDPSTTVSILFSIGSSSNYQVKEVVPYTTNEYILDDSKDRNKVMYIKLRLQNSNCDKYSNEFAYIEQ